MSLGSVILLRASQVEVNVSQICCLRMLFEDVVLKINASNAKIAQLRCLT